MPPRLLITLPQLEMAYQKWVQAYGDGRDHVGLRFGQWLYNGFGDGKPFARLFYAEEASKAYAIAKDDLTTTDEPDISIH